MPVKFGDLVLTDGGTANPVPFDLIRQSCDVLIAIDVSGTLVPDEDKPIPNMFESIMNTFQIMETTLIAHNLKANPPDLYVKPALRNIQLLDFHRDQEIMESVKEDVERFKTELHARVQSKDRPEASKERKWYQLLFHRQENRDAS